MIAVDTSSLVAFFNGQSGSDVDLVGRAWSDKQVILPPVVLSELLSQPRLPDDFVSDLLQIPLLEITDGYWGRAGLNRAKLLTRGLKARLADSLIAQSCMDHQTVLITRDGDFAKFKKYCGLLLGP